jgi:hypothetical protein
MVSFKAEIKKFGAKGEKTGWTYIEIPKAIAIKIHSTDKKSFRVKGSLDDCTLNAIAVLPMGEGNYILPFNAGIKKAIKKRPGAIVTLRIEADFSEIKIPGELQECLNDEPEAAKWFSDLKKGERNYFINWISSAKTEITRAKRIAMAINAFLNKMDFGAMIRQHKKDKVH